VFVFGENGGEAPWKRNDPERSSYAKVESASVEFNGENGAAQEHVAGRQRRAPGTTSRAVRAFSTGTFCAAVECDAERLDIEASKVDCRWRPKMPDSVPIKRGVLGKFAG
jgi:hypothetical protein